MTTRTIMTLVAAVAVALTVGATLDGCGTTATPPAGSAASSQSVAQDHNQADIRFRPGHDCAPCPGHRHVQDGRSTGGITSGEGSRRPYPGRAAT